MPRSSSNNSFKDDGSVRRVRRRNRSEMDLTDKQHDGLESPSKKHKRHHHTVIPLSSRTPCISYHTVQTVNGEIPRNLIAFFIEHCDRKNNPDTNISVPNNMLADYYIVAYEGRLTNMRKIHGAVALNHSRGGAFCVRDEHLHQESHPLNNQRNSKGRRRSGLEVNLICVNHASKRRGVATRLLQLCIELARCEGVPFVIAEPDTRVGDTRSFSAKPEIVSLFRKQGFQTVTPYLNPDLVTLQADSKVVFPQPPELRIIRLKPQPAYASYLQIARILTNGQTRSVKMIWVDPTAFES